MKSLIAHSQEKKGMMLRITMTFTISQISLLNSRRCLFSLQDVVITAIKKSKMKAPTWLANTFSLETHLKSQKTQMEMLKSKMMMMECLTEMEIKNTMKTSTGSCSSSTRSFGNTACSA